MSDLDVRTLLEGNAIFQEFKGALIQHEGEIIPVEVKAEDF